MAKWTPRTMIRKEAAARRRDQRASPTDRDHRQITVGARVMLDTLFPPDVPINLVNTVATVTRITRQGKLVVTADVDAYGERRVWPRCVSVRKAEQREVARAAEA